MDYPADFKILVDFLSRTKNTVVKTIDKVKSYLLVCLERGFNSVNENDRTGI